MNIYDIWLIGMPIVVATGLASLVALRMRFGETAWRRYIDSKDSDDWTVVGMAIFMTIVFWPCVLAVIGFCLAIRLIPMWVASGIDAFVRKLESRKNLQSRREGGAV